jgi:hypothetical protein
MGAQGFTLLPVAREPENRCKRKNKAACLRDIYSRTGARVETLQMLRLLPVD